MRRLLRASVVSALVLLALTVAAVLPWRWVAPTTTAFMVGQRLSSDEPVAYTWTPWDEISPDLAIAVVAAEDQKFPDHHGFDWTQIRDALEEGREGGRMRGASTISQQVAKNLFLWPGQSWIRKGAEAYLTVWIELLWPKRRILEVYLNVAEFGPGVFGVGAAADRLLHKQPADLDMHDASLLATVLPSPRRMRVASPSEYMRSRAAEISRAVRQLGGPAYLEGL